MGKITKEEMKYIFYSLIFAIIWFFVAIPYLQKSITSIPLQFVVFNLGVYFFLFIFLKSVITQTKINFRVSFGLILLFLCFDILLPEYHINTLGQLIPGALLGTSSADYFLGNLYSGFGVNGFMLFIMVYIISTALLLLGSSLLLKNMVKEI